MVKITPRYDLETLVKAIKQRDWKTATTIFKDHVFGWFIDHAKKIDVHGGYPKCSLALSWIEGFAWYYLDPKDIPRKKHYPIEAKSEALFIKMFHKVFDTTKADEDYIKRIYRSGRCGLAHKMMIREEIFLTRNFDKSFVILKKGKWARHKDPIFVNPEKLIEKIERFVNGWFEAIEKQQQPEFKHFKSMLRREFGNPKKMKGDKNRTIIREF